LDQAHLAAHASNLNLVTEARVILSGAMARYPAIARALLANCCGREMQRPILSDFPAAVLSEAARAVNTQEAARAVMLASARAEATSVGEIGYLAIAALDARFDEYGSEAITMGEVVCELDPLAVALGVYPIAQLAYHIYVDHHAPALQVGPDLAAISSNLVLAPSGVFNLDTAFAPFCMAHHTVTSEQVHFDATICYVNIVKALTRVRNEIIEVYADDNERITKRWTGFVRHQERVVDKRLRIDGNALVFPG